MRSPTQREYVFIVLLVVAALAYFWFRGGGMGLGGRSAQDDDSGPLGVAPIVRLDRLNLPPDDYDPEGRNLFKYGPPPAARGATVAPPPPPQRVEPPPRREPPPRQQQTQRAQTTTATARPPVPDFSYIGFLGPSRSRIAVFEGEEMMLARVGDVVQQQFRLKEFKYEVVVLGYTDERFRDQTTELEIKGKK